MFRLGKTHMTINKLGFGGIPIQRVDISECKQIINQAKKSGINFIDTAVGYTVSEEYIGEALKENPHSFYLATKSMSRTYEAMKKDILGSLDRLKRSYIDLYQIHNLGEADFELVFSENGALRALKEAKEQGIIKEIGITSHSVSVLDRAIDTDEFATVQFPFNIVENQGEQVFRKAKAKGMGTIVMKPLAGGALEDARLALRYLTKLDFLDVLIPGMADEKEIKVNQSAVEDDSPLTEKELADIKYLKENMGDKFCRRCGYCMPCTVGINIPMQFLLEGYLKRYDLETWAVDRYKSSDKNASDCIHCKECEPRCPYGLSISDMMVRVSAEFDKL